ncbi:MAG: hypothetical protein HYX45_06420 [Burkholderiales bacterium]|nr:hypothetical protein [Burkholderiales bacterium]
MTVLPSNSLRPILMRPVGVGQTDRSDEFYVMDSSSGVLTRISDSLVPQTKLVADGGGIYSFRQQNGWIIDVPHVFRLNETWIARAIGGDIQVETPNLKFRVIEDAIQIKVRTIGLIGRYAVTSECRGLKIFGWFWFPWSRTWFIGDESDRPRCMPFTELLYELSDARRAKKLASQWEMGIRVVSDAFNLPKDIQWSV